MKTLSLILLLTLLPFPQKQPFNFKEYQLFESGEGYDIYSVVGMHNDRVSFAVTTRKELQQKTQSYILDMQFPPRVIPDHVFEMPKKHIKYDNLRTADKLEKITLDCKDGIMYGTNLGNVEKNIHTLNTKYLQLLHDTGVEQHCRKINIPCKVITHVLKYKEVTVYYEWKKPLTPEKQNEYEREFNMKGQYRWINNKTLALRLPGEQYVAFKGWLLE